MHNAHTVRRLRKADAGQFREIRLEALRHAPDSFGTTYEQEAKRDIAALEDRIVAGCIFGAFSSERIVGMVGSYQ